MELLTELVKEKGIAKEIMDLKKQFELYEMILRNEDNTGKFGDNVFVSYNIWSRISKHEKLSEEFIREHKDDIVWVEICHNQVLSEDFIREFQDKMVWYAIGEHQVLSEAFMREMSVVAGDPILNGGAHLWWFSIIKYQTLSMDFIRKYRYRFKFHEMMMLSKTQKLSEVFIRKYRKDLHWGMISQNQVLSEEFIKEFKHKVNWNQIVINQKISYKFKEEYANYVNHKWVLRSHYGRVFHRCKKSIYKLF